MDDVTISGIGPPQVIAQEVAAAHDDLRQVMERIGCTFAKDKTSITATTRNLAANVAHRLGITGAVTSASCILGLDVTGGGRRARLRNKSKKAGRLRQALARRARLKGLHKAVGSRAIKVFRSGVMPSAAYDAPVWGISDSEVTKLRRLAAVTMSPRARGRSLAMTHLWHGLPTADVEVAPVLKSGEQWRVERTQRRAARPSPTFGACGRPPTRSSTP